MNISMKMGAVVLAVAVTGCVSSSKYKKLEAQKKAETAAMQAQIDQLGNERNQLVTEKGQLASEKSALEASSKETESQYQSLLGELQGEVQQGNLKITQYENMLKVDVAEQIFFASGSSKLKKTGQDVLKKVGDALAQYQDKVIRVVGHTDNVPLGKSAQAVFPSNWELSVIRATTVVRFLQNECKINPQNLIASGRAEYEPVAPNDSAAGRQKNRRIEITLIDKTIAEKMKSN
jgi:chemotaxis protein MotB